MEKRYHNEKRDFYFLKLEESRKMLMFLKSELDKINQDHVKEKFLFENILNKIKELEKIFEEDMHKALNDAFFGFNSAIEKFNLNQHLSYEEYHLLAAANILFFKGPPEDTEFGRFDLTWYQDEDIFGYIDLFVSSHEPGEIRPLWGIEPESVKLNALRPDQHKYFKKFYPEVYKRFIK